MESNKLNIEKLQIEGDELVYRTGTAPDLDSKKGLTLKGDLDSPKNFFKAYEDRWKDLNKYVEVDLERGIVELAVNSNSKLEETTIRGTIILHWIIEKFRINDDSHSFTKPDLIRLLKSYRYMFDINKNLALVTALEELDIHFDKKVKDHDNRRGSYHQEIKQVCTTSLPTSINITFDPFNKGNDITFELELHFEIKGDLPEFHFQSPALIEYIESQKALQLKEAIDIFESDVSIPVIYV